MGNSRQRSSPAAFFLPVLRGSPLAAFVQPLHFGPRRFTLTLGLDQLIVGLLHRALRVADLVAPALQVALRLLVGFLGLFEAALRPAHVVLGALNLFVGQPQAPLGFRQAIVAERILLLRPGDRR